MQHKPPPDPLLKPIQNTYRPMRFPSKILLALGLVAAGFSASQAQTSPSKSTESRTNETFAQANAIHKPERRHALHAFGHLGLETAVARKFSLAILTTAGPDLDSDFDEDTEKWSLEATDTWNYRGVLELRYRPFADRATPLSGPFVGPYVGLFGTTTNVGDEDATSSTTDVNSAAGGVLGYQLVTPGGFVVSGLTGVGTRNASSGDSETDFRLGFSVGFAF